MKTAVISFTGIFLFSFLLFRIILIAHPFGWAFMLLSFFIFVHLGNILCIGRGFLTMNAIVREPLFTHKPEEYQRDINILPHAVLDAAFFLHKQTNLPIEECKEFVMRKLKPGGDMAIVDPMINCLSKEKEGERSRLQMPFTKYLRDVVDSGNLISPTMAVYTNPKVELSLLSEYIAGNIVKRAIAKKEGFQAEIDGNKVLAIFKDLEQTCAKLDNNGLSGAHCSPSTILFNMSSHSTLTSTCRSATSYGNTNNEKFVAGKRHYWNPKVVLYSLVTISRHIDRDLTRHAIDECNLTIPTYQDVIDCVVYSSKSYWRDPIRMKQIEDYIYTMDDLERAAFLYIGDLYHLAKLNDSFVRVMLGELAKKDKGPIDTPDYYIGLLDADLVALISLLCRQELNGKNIKKLKEEDYPNYLIVAATAKRCLSILEGYRTFIKAFWVSDIIPSSIAVVPTVLRYAVLGSDTDSTIFTVESWTEWYTGKLGFDDLSCDIAHVVAFLTSQSVIHILAIMSANMGIATEHIHRLAMKNEYWFPVFVLTDRAKHYYAYQGAKEGNVFKKFKLEKKGVALRSSLVSIPIMESFDTCLCETMNKVMQDGKIDLSWALEQVWIQERMIFNSIYDASPAYLKGAQIKPKDNYKSEDNATYLQYEMWKEVFAPKYGQIEPPPYSCVKVTLDIKNNSKFKEWLASLSDRELAERLAKWMEYHRKTMLTNFLIPASIANENGVPKELVSAINVRKLAYETLESFYIWLGSLGIFMINDNLTVLVTDFYKPELRETITRVAG